MDGQLTLKAFGLILPAVAEMMQEQNLSTDETLIELRRMLGPGDLPIEVRRAIERLEQVEDELTLLYELGQESLRAMESKAGRTR